MTSETPVPDYLRRSMIERVARALCRIGFEQDPRVADVTVQRCVDECWPDWKPAASAAIEAMREPNLAMRKVCTFKDAEVTWPAMVDAALALPEAAGNQP